MELIWLPLVAVYVYAIYVCFQKGKTGFAWTGIAGFFPLFAPILAWFPIVGALRPAKPGSPWVLDGDPSRTETVYRTAPPPVAHQPSPGSPRLDPTRPSDEISQFLERAVAAGVIHETVRRRLVSFHNARQAAVIADRPLPDTLSGPAADFMATAPPQVDQPEARPAPPPAPAQVPADPTSRAASPWTATPAPPPPPATTDPSPVARWIDKLRDRATELWAAASSDIAVHGLAYLGVLLTFIGVLGFLLFAFADVPDSVQPLVELFIASVFFGWAWLLRRQQASTVANALELIGGMTLPLIL